MKNTHNLSQCKGDTGRGIRVGDDDAAIRASIVGRIECEVRPQRDLPKDDLIKGSIGGVKTIGDICKKDRALATEQAVKAMGQHLVAAIVEKDAVSRQPVSLRDRLGQTCRGRIGIKPKIVIGGGADGIQNP